MVRFTFFFSRHRMSTGPIFAPDALSRLAHPVRIKMFKSGKPVRACIQAVDGPAPPPPVKGTRKRRAPIPSFYKLPGTLGNTTQEVKEPVRLHDMGVCILNAIATRLPLPATCGIFGQKIPIELIGVLFRNHNLVWIIRCKLNDCLYLSSHFLADVVHLFEVCRARMPSPEVKHNRQSFNNATKVQGVTLAKLCLGVTRLQSHQVYLNTVLNFIRTGRLLTDLPVNPQAVSIPPSQAIAQYVTGWKVFVVTEPMSGRCSANRRSKTGCTCEKVIQEAEEDIRDSTVPVGLLVHLPSNLKPEVLEHYK